jgi:Arc/MetJ family transcription regulator
MAVKDLHIMRTNISIDDKLMADVMALSGARSKREAVEMGLKALLDIKGQAGLKALRGKLNWVGDLEAMRLD